MKPGVRACDVFQFCVEAYAKMGIEYDLLLCVEPAYLGDSRLGGYQVEDLVRVTEDGAAILTNRSDTQELFVIR